MSKSPVCGTLAEMMAGAGAGAGAGIGSWLTWLMLTAIRGGPSEGDWQRPKLPRCDEAANTAEDPLLLVESTWNDALPL